jgi:rubrerythrin
VVALGNAAYHMYNATARNRMSRYDITNHNEEIDPIASRLGYQHSLENKGSDRQKDAPRKYEGDFCPFCGASVSNDFAFCPKCGKAI